MTKVFCEFEIMNFVIGGGEEHGGFPSKSSPDSIRGARIKYGTHGMMKNRLDSSATQNPEEDVHFSHIKNQFCMKFPSNVLKQAMGTINSFRIDCSLYCLGPYG